MYFFTFELNIIFSSVKIATKPFLGITALIKFVMENFHLSRILKMIQYDEDDEIILSNDSDYYNMIEYSESKKLKVIEIFIKNDEDDKILIKEKSHSLKGEKDSDCVNGN